MKKRSFYAIVILSVALILVSVLCIMIQREQAELRQAIDTTYKESFLRILDSMHQMEDPSLGEEEKQMLSARDTGYGFNLRTLQFTTSFAHHADFYTISQLLDEATGTNAIYTLTYSEELYDTLMHLYEDDFQDEDLLEKARTLLEAAMD